MSTSLIAGPTPKHREGASGGAMRLDIQALRAAAVVGVVMYHVWPKSLPGGFVGVDVFFVISGFLITTHLLGHPPRHPLDFAGFWSRRILRLLPPVVVVILTTLAGVLLFMSPGQWWQMARESATSMFYVQNWQLISDATDYLNAHQAPSPFQHFWSLSVEEQYYIAWPFIVALLTLLASRIRGRGRAAIYGTGFGLVLVISFVYSIVHTDTSPASSYFSTFTRAWELAIGSALAVIYPLLRDRMTYAVRAAVLWLGIVGIALSYVVIDDKAPFPGSIAALPTVASALVILAGDPDRRFNPRWLTHSRPVQMLGNSSYALYLWHWPLIVLAPYVAGRDLHAWEKVPVVILAVALAWLSTNLLEDPVRGAAFFRGHLPRVYALGAVCSCVVLTASLALTVHVDRQVAHTQAQLAAAKRTDACFGAAAMDPKNHCSSITGPKLLTTPAFAKADVSAGIRACLNWPPFKDVAISCHRGDTTNPTKKIAVFGNSHAGQWTEALTKIANKHHFEVDTYIIGACFSATEPQSQDCTKITKDATDRIINGGYDEVVYATYDPNPASTVAMYADTINAFTASGAHVLVIRDTPAPWDSDHWPADCVAQHPHHLQACAGTPQKYITPDLLAQAAAQSHSPNVSLVDLNKYICTKTVCPAVIGGVIVLSDYNHMSRTFSRTLAPYLEPAVLKAMG